MIEIRKKSALPIYGAAVVWIIYCLFFPLYKASHFVWLVIASAAAYIILSKVIPDTVTYLEKEPEKTGDQELDKLIEKGAGFERRFQELRQDFLSTPADGKAQKIITLTGKIFSVLYEYPSCKDDVESFSSYFLPATEKLMVTYGDMCKNSGDGENASKIKKSIEDALDIVISAFEKQLDALFAGRALDIETDITVLKNMMKSSGLSQSDFDI